MATLTVWGFDTADGAGEAETLLLTWQEQHLLRVVDAALATWPTGAKRPTTRQLHRLAGRGAFGGAFWGLLFGVLFTVPVVALALGAALGGLGGALTDMGIDDGFVNRVRDTIRPGTSALFLMTMDAARDELHTRARAADLHATLLETNLNATQEAALRAIFD